MSSVESLKIFKEKYRPKYIFKVMTIAVMATNSVTQTISSTLLKCSTLINSFNIQINPLILKNEAKNL